MATRKLGSVKATDTMLITSANLASEVTGVLSVANGGTGQSVYTDGQILYGVTAGNTLAKGDHGNIAGLGDDDHTQYYNQARGDARYLTLSGGTMTGKITLDGDPSSSLHAAPKNYVDNSDATNLALVPLLAGRAGGQTIIGGTAASENLTLVSTSHATKGYIVFGNGSTLVKINNTGNIGIGTANPSANFGIYSAVNNSNTLPMWKIENQGSGDASYFFAAGGQVWSMGIDGTDTKFKVSHDNAGADVGTNTKLCIDLNGNIGINGQATFGDNAVGVFAMANATAPTTSPANAIQFWSDAGEMKVRDASGNVTTLSPHHFIMAPSEEMAWSFYSERGAKYIYADMAKALRILESLSGQKLIHIGALK